MSADTSTIVATGRMSPNTSACTAPTSCHRLMSVTNIRVRTTSDNDAPASRERDLDAAQRFPGLRGDAIAGCGGACDDDERTDAHGAGVADPVLERRPRRDGDPALRHAVNDIRVRRPPKALPRLTHRGNSLGLAPWIVYWVLVGNVPFPSPQCWHWWSRSRRSPWGVSANVLAAIGNWRSIDVPGADRADVRGECSLPWSAGSCP